MDRATVHVIPVENSDKVIIANMNPRSQPVFQFHLSTALVIVCACAIYIGISLTRTSAHSWDFGFPCFLFQINDQGSNFFGIQFTEAFKPDLALRILTNATFGFLWVFTCVFAAHKLHSRHSTEQPKPPRSRT